MDFVEIMRKDTNYFRDFGDLLRRSLLYSFCACFMVTTRFYLDSRRANGGTYSLRINITHKRKSASFPLDIQLTVEQWNTSTATIQNHPKAKFLNTLINKCKVEIDTIILNLSEFENDKLAGMSAIEIRD